MSELLKALWKLARIVGVRSLTELINEMLRAPAPKDAVKVARLAVIQSLYRPVPETLNTRETIPDP